MEGLSKVGKGAGCFCLKKAQCKEPKVWVCKVLGSERCCLFGKRAGCNLDWYLEVAGEYPKVPEGGGSEGAEKGGA